MCTLLCQCDGSAGLVCVCVRVGVGAWQALPGAAQISFADRNSVRLTPQVGGQNGYQGSTPCHHCCVSEGWGAGLCRRRCEPHDRGGQRRQPTAPHIARRLQLQQVGRKRHLGRQQFQPVLYAGLRIHARRQDWAAAIPRVPGSNVWPNRLPLRTCAEQVSFKEKIRMNQTMTVLATLPLRTCAEQADHLLPWLDVLADTDWAPGALPNGGGGAPAVAPTAQCPLEAAPWLNFVANMRGNHDGFCARAHTLSQVGPIRSISMLAGLPASLI